MITTTPATTTRIDSPPDLRRIRDHCDRVLSTVAACDLDDALWLQAGPLVTRSATRLRAAIGLCALVAKPAPPIVAVRDLSTAERQMLRSDVQIVDPGAAAEFVALGWQIERVLGGRHVTASVARSGAILGGGP